MSESEINTVFPRGVSLLDNGRFKAQVHANDVTHSLGHYATVEQARAAYVKGCKKYRAEHLIKRAPLTVKMKEHERREAIMRRTANMSGSPIQDTLDKMKEIQNEQHRQIKALTKRIKQLEELHG